MVLDIHLRQVKDTALLPFIPVFKFLHPNTITLLSGVAGWYSAWLAGCGQFTSAALFFWVNRILDGVDGVVARETNSTSLFGGYLDIFVDFTVYSIIPIAMVIGVGADGDTAILHGIGILENRWLSLAVLEATYFVNCATLFQLSAILEKAGMSWPGELTTVTMPPSLIEGAETVVMYSLFFWMPERIALLFNVFSLLVFVSALYRVFWAAQNLPKLAAAASQKSK